MGKGLVLSDGAYKRHISKHLCQIIRRKEVVTVKCADAAYIFLHLFHDNLFPLVLLSWAI